MPRSAIATGLVDYVLVPAEMPPRLVTYAKHAFGKLPVIASLPPAKSENALRKIFILLRAQTDHDFSQYKPSTIHRRIDRRMAVHQIDTVDDYVKYLQQTPAEVEALFRDLLIGVTKFFRDPEAFQVLEEEIIPKLLADKHPGEVIRIWTPGCSTGEEAYSIAMLLVECMEAQHRYHPVQIFATDIDSRAIATARSGTYPSNIAADVTPERLMRFFTPEAKGGGYRVHKNIRDILIFSEQDLIMDPPFSKLDFISCRNLLIYLSAELQKKIIPLFHYSLKPCGILFLGNSEGVSEFGDLFDVLDRKHKIYQRKGDLHGLPRSVLGQFIPSARSRLSVPPSDIATKPNSPPTPPLRELTEQALLRQVAPAAALINGQGDILYLHGRTGMFLEMVPGEVGINNITKMAREGLRAGLIAGLHKSIAIKETVRCPSLRVKVNGSFITAALTILPVTSGPGVTPESPLYLVIIEEAPTGETLSPHPPTGPEPDADSLIAALRQELRAKEDQLQSANEELESSTEELESSNEEMQSVNEELQSTNEELETSKEELQSVNEELSTVNTELQIKISDLTRTNNDMNNLLAGTGVGTVFVDHQLRVLRFTPAASLIINLIPGDVGRPVAHIASNLVGYDRFFSDIQSVLDTLVPKDVSVRATNGRWYSVHIQPYRTLENVIEGAVISFVDITEVMEAREQLRGANEQLRHLAVIVRDAYDAITVQDLEGNILAWNPGAVRAYGWTESEALKMNVRDRIPGEQQGEELARLSRLGRSDILEPYDTQRLTKDGRIISVSMVSTALLDESGKMYAIATTERMRVS
jgi:two-component system CheB/CheR fusion protein